jgi:hypothetical protein
MNFSDGERQAIKLDERSDRDSVGSTAEAAEARHPASGGGAALEKNAVLP